MNAARHARLRPAVARIVPAPANDDQPPPARRLEVRPDRADAIMLWLSLAASAGLVAARLAGVL